MSYNEQKPTNENKKKVNLDEVIEDEFNLSKKRQKINDAQESVDSAKPQKVNLNEVL